MEISNLKDSVTGWQTTQLERDTAHANEIARLRADQTQSAEKHQQALAYSRNELEELRRKHAQDMQSILEKHKSVNSGKDESIQKLN